MTVFCTACGKPNTDEAEKCVSCGHQLKASEPSSKKKFKGTMMMGASGDGPGHANKGPMQSPGSGVSPGSQADPAQPATPQATPSPQQSDTSGAVQAGAASAKRNMAFQKTMMGPAGGMEEILKQQNAPEQPSDGPTDVERVTDQDGAPSSISQPPGGFGPPAQGSSGFGPPPQGSSGFGPPASSADASSSAASGFAPPSETGAVNADDITSGPPSGSFGSGGAGGDGKNNKTKYFIIGGIGCLVLLMLTCVIVGWMMYSAMKEAVEEAQLQVEQGNNLGAGVQGELARLDLSASLSSLQMICDMDRSAEGARGTFHPDVFESLRGEACRVNRSTVTAFNDAANSEVSPGGSELPGTSDCYTFASGGASITTCKYEGNTVITAMQGVDQVR